MTTTPAIWQAPGLLGTSPSVFSVLTMPQLSTLASGYTLLSWGDLAPLTDYFIALGDPFGDPITGNMGLGMMPPGIEPETVVFSGDGTGFQYLRDDGAGGQDVVMQLWQFVVDIRGFMHQADVVLFDDSAVAGSLESISLATDYDASSVVYSYSTLRPDGGFNIWFKSVDRVTFEVSTGAKLHQISSAAGVEAVLVDTVTANAATGLVATTWIERYAGAADTLMLQLHDIDGNAIIERRVAAGHEYTGVSATALGNGNVLLTWTRDNGAETDSSVRYRIYDSAGNALTGVSTASASLAGEQWAPNVAVLKDGGFMIAWIDTRNSVDSVHCQRFDAGGAKAGDELVLYDGFTTVGLHNVALTTMADGRVMLAWQDSAQVFSAILDPRDVPGAPIAYYGGHYVMGTTGDDVIAGDAIDGLELYGWDGNDTITDGAGDTVIDGGSGLDRIIVTSSVDNDHDSYAGGGGDIIDWSGIREAGLVFDLLSGSVTNSRSGNSEVMTGFTTLFGSQKGDTIFGTTVSDTIHGGGGNDEIDTLGAGDTIYGDAGDDTVHGGAGNDTMDGGEGTDTLDYSNDADGVDVDLEAGTVSGSAVTDTVTGFENVIGSAFFDTLQGDDADNVLKGGGDRDIVSGGLGADTLQGGNGDDTLNGDDGRDTLDGGGGADQLSGGGGADVFLYADTGDSPKGNNRDVIADFATGSDVIDLSAIDAVEGSPGSSFTFVDQAGFSNTAGELRWRDTAGGVLVEADTDGNGKADLQIQLSAGLVITADAFVL